MSCVALPATHERPALWAAALWAAALWAAACGMYSTRSPHPDNCVTVTPRSLPRCLAASLPRCLAASLRLTAPDAPLQVDRRLRDAV